MEENKSSNAFLTMIGLTFILISCALAYISYDRYMNTYQISKAKFLCTKIEQVGKNMDDVVCVQYTEQKFSKEAVALNKVVMMEYKR